MNIHCWIIVHHVPTVNMDIPEVNTATKVSSTKNMAVIQIVSGLLIVSCITSLSSGLQGHTPTHPQPSESSSAHITHIWPDSLNYHVNPTSQYMELTNIARYSYDLYKNYGSGNILYVYKLGTTNVDYGSRYYLIRDDLSTTFQYYEPFGVCGKPFGDDAVTTKVLDSPGLGFPARWTWLNETKYSGTVKFHNRDVDMWTYTYRDSASNTATFQNIGVLKRNPNILNFYFMYTVNGSGFSVNVFDKFKNGDPPDAVFKIPAVCNANELGNSSMKYGGQIPKRPVLAESFSAEIMYVRFTFYVDEETLKPAKLYRNYVTKRQLQVNPLGHTTYAGKYYQLLRMDEKIKQYTYFEPFKSCHVDDLNSQSVYDRPPGPGVDRPMWEWIKYARFSGVKKFQGQKVNMWTHTINETFYSLGVSRRHPNRPIVLFEMHTYYTYMRNVTVFSKYNPGPPRESIFKIPDECYEK